MDRVYHNNASHRIAAKKHFFRRCNERHGLTLTDEDYRRIMAAIRGNQTQGLITAFFARDLDPVTKLYKLNIDDVSMYVIYDLRLNELTTALSNNPKEIQYYAVGTSIF